MVADTTDCSSTADAMLDWFWFTLSITEVIPAIESFTWRGSVLISSILELMSWVTATVSEGQLPDLAGHHGEAPPGLAGPRRIAMEAVDRAAEETGNVERAGRLPCRPWRYGTRSWW